MNCVGVVKIVLERVIEINDYVVLVFDGFFFMGDIVEFVV